MAHKTTNPRTQLARAARELDRVGDYLGLPDALDAIVNFCQQVEGRFFQIQYDGIIPGEDWQVDVFIGADWTHPRGQATGLDTWLKTTGPTALAAAEASVLELKNCVEPDDDPEPEPDDSLEPRCSSGVPRSACCGLPGACGDC
jgi:hypothetical protein